jgi:hypothetical protein
MKCFEVAGLTNGALCATSSTVLNFSLRIYLKIFHVAIEDGTHGVGIAQIKTGNFNEA